MGAVTFSLDDKLVKYLRKVLPLDVLVETGTFQGETLTNMADLFSELHSVELSQELFERAAHCFAEREHVHVCQGDSPEFLRRLGPHIAGRSVLFWLDAHWCVRDAAAGEESQCPLLEELAAIGQVDDRSVVLIDDARLYLCPAPAPHKTGHWPSLGDVLSALRALNDRHEVMVVNDVLLFYPPTARAALHSYAHEHGVDWLAVMVEKHEPYDLQKQLRQVREHLAALKQTAATYETAIEKQEQRLDRYRQLVAQGKEQTDGLRDTIHQLEQTNLKQAEIMDALRASLHAAQQTCDAQRRRNQQQEEALARKQADLERVRSDLSHRLETLREQLDSRTGKAQPVCGTEGADRGPAVVHAATATSSRQVG
jgi:hypothetical protein